MKCCVPGCQNISKANRKLPGVTFHVFPSEPSLQNVWLRIIDKPSWKPRDVVCSDHFAEGDMFVNKEGLQVVKQGATPIMLQEFINCDPNAALNVCRICLATDCLTSLINKRELCEAYQHLTGLQILKEDKLPKMLCTECANKVLDSNQFRNKCLRTNILLLDILNEGKTLSIKHLNVINNDIELISDTANQENNVNVNGSDTTQSDNKDVRKSKEVDADVNSGQVFDMDVKMEEDDNVDTLVEETALDEASCNDVKYEDEDFGRDDTDDSYASSDSLPLELCKRKKKKKKKLTKDVVAKKISKRKEIRETKVDGRRKPFLTPDLRENLFTITDLTLEEQMADILKRQESSNYKKSQLKCDKCFKGFIDVDAYNTHMRRHSSANGAYPCPVCQTHFQKSHAMKKHVTAHHSQRFSCNQCDYSTTHRQSARLHVKWHKGTQYVCPHCSEVFQKCSTYMGHIRIKHPSDFVCQLCGYSFVSQKGIDLHKSLKHQANEDEQIPEDGPLCEPCDVRFISTAAYNKHLEVSAKHKSPSQGAKKRNEYYEPKRHLRTVAGDNSLNNTGPIPCEQCGVQLPDNRAYHSHFRRIHPDKNRTNYPSMKAPCMCEVCGKMFQSHALLKDHGWVHTGELAFKCDICDKSFRMRQRLVTHKKVHQPGKPRYQCNVCGKHFSTQSNKQRHMIIHTGLKPFKCEMCGKTFKHSGEKRAHILYVHLKKPWPKRSRNKKRADTGPANAWVCDKPDVAELIDKSAYYNVKI